MGSSAGGIIALAVSTDIEPCELQKICYKMGTITRVYRIDRKYLLGLKEIFPDETALNMKEKETIETIIDLLSEYGVIHRSSMEQIRKIMNSIDKNRLSIVYQKMV